MIYWIAGEWVVGTGEKLELYMFYSYEFLW